MSLFMFWQQFRRQRTSLLLRGGTSRLRGSASCVEHFEGRSKRRKVRNIRDNKVVNWVDGQRKNLLYFPDWFVYTFQTVVGELLKNYSLTVIQGQDLTQKWLPVSRPKAEVKVKFRKKTGS